MIRRITTVITPASNRRLASRSLFKQGPSLKDGNWDEYIDFLRDSKSQAFEQACDRVFARETVQDQFIDVNGAARYYDWGLWGNCGSRAGSSNALLLSRRPISSIVSVVDGTGTIDPTRYAFDSSAGILYSLSGGCSDAPAPGPWFGTTVTVQYIAGYVLPDDAGRDLPYDIEEAVITLMRAAIKAKDRDPALRSQSDGAIGSQSIWLGMPPDVQAVIDSYRNESIA